jgi:hypothetical protein
MSRRDRGCRSRGRLLPLGFVPLLALVACSIESPRQPARLGTAATAPRVQGVSEATGVEDPTRRARGSDRWRLRRPARAGQIEGWTTQASGEPGNRVDLRVSTAARHYRVTAYRLGAYRGGSGRAVWRSKRLEGRLQPAADLVARTRTVTAPWRTTSTVDTTGWVPGVYVFELRTRSGLEAHVPYVVRSRSAQGRLLLVAPVTTWQAYNDWGGYSLYTAPPGDRRGWAVSFDRPYPAPGSGQMLFGVVPVVLAAERAGLPLAYATNVDLHTDPGILRGAAGYVSMGHDEYWTPRVRRRVTTARDAGTNLAFLGANTAYWRIRLSPTTHGPARLVVGYRSDAHLDPAPAEASRTGLLRDAPGRSPGEHRLTGMLYECFPVDAPYVVVSPRWWGFRGTGVRHGDAFAHLVGVEADRVYPIPGTPRRMQVLSHTGYSCGGVATSAQSVYYAASSGAGVLNVGTLRWTCALSGRCPPYDLPRATTRFVRRVTLNVLRAFAAGPAAARWPPEDNVSEFRLPSVNAVPAS